MVTVTGRGPHPNYTSFTHDLKILSANSRPPGNHIHPTYKKPDLPLLNSPWKNQAKGRLNNKVVPPKTIGMEKFLTRKLIVAWKKTHEKYLMVKQGSKLPSWPFWTRQRFLFFFTQIIIRKGSGSPYCLHCRIHFRLAQQRVSLKEACGRAAEGSHMPCQLLSFLISSEVGINGCILGPDKTLENQWTMNIHRVPFIKVNRLFFPLWTRLLASAEMYYIIKLLFDWFESLNFPLCCFQTVSAAVKWKASMSKCHIIEAVPIRRLVTNTAARSLISFMYYLFDTSFLRGHHPDCPLTSKKLGIKVMLVAAMPLSGHCNHIHNKNHNPDDSIYDFFIPKHCRSLSPFERIT